VTDPLKVIQNVKERLARLAALQTLASLFPPLLVLLAAGFGLGALGQHSWERWGLVLPSDSAHIVQLVLWSAAALGVVITAVLAWNSFMRNRDPVTAAELIDRKLGCREEILTLATLSIASNKAERSPLFPVLWNRAAQRLDQLDPSKICSFEVRQSLRQALFLIVVTTGLVAAAISVLLAANKPPLLAEARQLRKFAREIANSNPADRQAQQLAQRLREAAAAISDPKVPPHEKAEQLARVEQEVKRQQQRQQESAASKAQSAGKGQGSGSGKNQASAGKGQQGSAGTGSGNGNGGGGAATAKNGKGQAQLAQASTDIAKIQARLEAEAKQKSGQEQKNGLKGRAPRPGEQPQLASLDKPGNSPNLNQSKPDNEHNQEQNNSQRQSGQQHKDFGSSRGDTHLGQFPQPENFEKFYKAGEHGIPMDVKNARYVLFRVPPALISAGGGKTVIDTERPSATVPYANLPLKEERVAAEPDEQQLIPPRYRDLLR
jgi:hypothetical protein